MAFITSPDGSKKASKYNDLLEVVLERKQRDLKEKEIADAVAKAKAEAAPAARGLFGSFF